MKCLRIVFMGTPEFAVPMLDSLLQTPHEVAAVVTSPDKPAGRGMQLQQSPVKQFALHHNLKIFQPEKLKNEAFLTELRAVGADLFVIVAFRMLPEVVWNMPPMGSINLHASLLPQYRGAAPINWAIINGERETGVTTFFLRHEIDTGNIIFQEKVAIGEEETAGELYERLMWVGAKLLVKTINAIAEGNFPQTPQAHITDVKHAPKIFKEHCLIDFKKSALELVNFIRGLCPHPGAYTVVNRKILKLFKAKAIRESHHYEAGAVVTDHKSFLRFACADGFIEVLDLQLEGKKRMDVKSFLQGNLVLQ